MGIDSERFVLDTQLPVEDSPEDVGPYIGSPSLVQPPSTSAVATAPTTDNKTASHALQPRAEVLVPDTDDVTVLERPRLKMLKTRKSHGSVALLFTFTH